MRQLLSSKRGVALALAVLLVIGGALRADRAAHPTTAYQSADERSYGYLALQIAEHGTYGDRSDAAAQAAALAARRAVHVLDRASDRSARVEQEDL